MSCFQRLNPKIQPIRGLIQCCRSHLLFYSLAFRAHRLKLFIVSITPSCSLHIHFPIFSSLIMYSYSFPQYVIQIFQLATSCARTKSLVLSYSLQFTLFHSLLMFPLVFLTLMIFTEEGHISRLSNFFLRAYVILCLSFLICDPSLHTYDPFLSFYCLHWWSTVTYLIIVFGSFFRDISWKDYMDLQCDFFFCGSSFKIGLSLGSLLCIRAF